ncbi:hypothetical protein PSP6_10065 [Paraburkholderia tropica]|nr:hypothetical protein PSP6_10065 [Paraburkholderia tropica]
MRRLDWLRTSTMRTRPVKIKRGDSLCIPNHSSLERPAAGHRPAARAHLKTIRARGTPAPVRPVFCLF